MSIEVNPGIGAAAAWVAVQIAKGTEVPKTMVMPVLTITQSTLSQYENTPVTTTASHVPGLLVPEEPVGGCANEQWAGAWLHWR